MTHNMITLEADYVFLVGGVMGGGLLGRIGLFFALELESGIASDGTCTIGTWTVPHEKTRVERRPLSGYDLACYILLFIFILIPQQRIPKISFELQRAFCGHKTLSIVGGTWISR